MEPVARVHLQWVEPHQAFQEEARVYAWRAALDQLEASSDSFPKPLPVWFLNCFRVSLVLTYIIDRLCLEPICLVLRFLAGTVHHFRPGQAAARLAVQKDRRYPTECIHPHSLNSMWQQHGTGLLLRFP